MTGAPSTLQERHHDLIEEPPSVSVLEDPGDGGAARIDGAHAPVGSLDEISGAREQMVLVESEESGLIRGQRCAQRGSIQVLDGRSVEHGFGAKGHGSVHPRHNLFDVVALDGGDPCTQFLQSRA
jgi:hypothetical protein